METEHRTTAPDLETAQTPTKKAERELDLVDAILAEAHDYSFFNLTDLILKYMDHDVEEKALHEQGAQGLMFLSDPSLGFPSSDVGNLQRVEGRSGEQIAMTVNFLGLHGSSSPLPDYLLEPIAQSRNEGPGAAQQGLTNFFSNRMVWFLYLIWRKYRYDLRYKMGAKDQFSNWLFSIIGLEGDEVREGSSVDFPKLLAFSGMLAGRTRNPAQMGQVIAYMFDLEGAEIEEFTERVVSIPDDQKLALGAKNATLGHDTVIGDAQKDIMGRFTVHLKNLNFKRFGDFLPRGKDFMRLRELVEFLLKDQLAYDFKLSLSQGEAPCLKLGCKENGYLGWTSFIGNAERDGPRDINVVARS